MVQDHIAEWQISLTIYEHGDDSCLARVVLDTGANTLTAEGLARRNPKDTPIPEIGDELAAGRALVEMGTRLLMAASDDIAAATRSAASV